MNSGKLVWKVTSAGSKRSWGKMICRFTSTHVLLPHKTVGLRYDVYLLSTSVTMTSISTGKLHKYSTVHKENTSYSSSLWISKDKFYKTKGKSCSFVTLSFFEYVCNNIAYISYCTDFNIFLWLRKHIYGSHTKNFTKDGYHELNKMKAPASSLYIITIRTSDKRRQKKWYSQYQTLRTVKERVDKDNKRHKEREPVLFHLSWGVSH